MAADIFQRAFRGRPVRLLLDEHGAPWWIAKDVLAVLDLNRSSIALLDEDEKGVHGVYTPGGEQQLATITEAGLYSLIFRSRKAEAVYFKRWVTHEVLPSIRKTGAYSELSGPELMARALIEAQSTIEAAERRVKELEPSAHSWDTLVAETTGDWSMRDAAQILSRDPGIDIGQNRLARLLRELRWIDERSVPYQRHVAVGRIRSRARTYEHPRTGERLAADPQVRITAKGLAWLHQHLGGLDPLDTTERHLEVVS